ncbi:MAG: ATP-binding protein [Candidatus Omnitrophica bacterium]|nr:ATP-binding protein [Candidatus Omnitrophota bacterium]
MNKNIQRLLKIKLPRGQSAFLWGPRKTGKSTFLRQHFPKSIIYDFLNTDLYVDLVKKPSLLRQHLSALKVKGPVILDEVQKIPAILDEVHWMIENMKLSFILCGSSARKLKRGQANLLGGRAWRFEMFPLVYPEIENFNLLHALNNGLLPAHYLQKDASKSLDGYVKDYLKEEVFEEGLTRNIPAFSRFFDSMSFDHGQMVNFTNIARDCSVDVKTVQQYYQILVDTFLGSFVEPYKRKQDRAIISRTQKFYLFDVGVAGAITRRHIAQEAGEEFGKAFEHFIFTQLVAYNSYKQKNIRINYWRTKSGLEVDFILGKGEVAIEVKGASRVDFTDIKGLRAFYEEHRPKKAIVVTNERVSRIERGIRFLPWGEFLSLLWRGDLI